MAGVGAPDSGMSILIGSPARTLMRLPESPSKLSFGGSFIGLAVIG